MGFAMMTTCYGAVGPRVRRKCKEMTYVIYLFIHKTLM